jgi:hypothetical protein
MTGVWVENVFCHRSHRGRRVRKIGEHETPSRRLHERLLVSNVPREMMKKHKPTQRDERKTATAESSEDTEKISAGANLRKTLDKSRPSDFMRARRPELYSDSKTFAEKSLSRELLEYHLETLTNRKQETQFEYFCRRLAERELCPNLLPQTGPTGGGDSKVDSETYPVSDAISLGWYEGIGREANRERWAFAFSAKKDWKTKVASDVKKIVGAKRDYKLIYFLSNQFISDKKRAATEDTLAKKYKLAIRILDRSWIVERVFKNDRIELAVQSLALTEVASPTRKRVGPRDLERETELRELDSEIDDPARYSGVGYQRAEDALRSAILARGLERPRSEIEGRFTRAETIAEKINNKRQKLRITYARAWTAVWWFDDIEELDRLYDVVDSLAESSDEVTDIGLVFNLWLILASPAGNYYHAKQKDRTKKLLSQLKRLASEKHRPNNALEARSMSLLMELTIAIRQSDRKGIDGALRGFKSILRAAKTLGRYPVEHLAHIIEEMGSGLRDSSVYDELFEIVVSLVAERKSEGGSGGILMRGGYRKLEAGKPYQAIRLFGRAQEKLSKYEYLRELLSALVGCALAYERAGLLWAARTNLLAAAADAISEFRKHGNFGIQALRYLRRLMWLELQLGRIPNVLSLTVAADALQTSLKIDQGSANALAEDRETLDLVLGMLFLRAPLSSLAELASLPDMLGNLNYVHSRIALLYALGYENQLREEGWLPSNEDDSSVHDFFEKWVQQPAIEDLPSQPQQTAESKVIFRSVVLGCELSVTSANNLRSIQLAEAVLGAIESVLATSLDQRIFPYRQTLNITVEPEKDPVDIVTCRVCEIDGESAIEIRHNGERSPTTRKERTRFHRFLVDVIAQLIPLIALPADVDAYLSRVMGEERGLNRALDFSEVFITQENILGKSQPFRVRDWADLFQVQKFPLVRITKWSGDAEPEETQKPDKELARFASSDPPRELTNTESLKHSNVKVISLIDVPLWNRAEWKATGFAWPRDLVDVPPLLALCFENEEAAKGDFPILEEEARRN